MRLFRSQVPSSPEHWSKDFVEHLRTVHFALIGASTAVILAAASVKPYNPVIAVRQVSEIIELQKLWGPRFVESRLTDWREQGSRSAANDGAANEVRDESPAVYYRELEPLGSLGTTHWTSEQRRGARRVVFVFPEPELMSKLSEGEPEWDAKRLPAKTLGDFQLWWDDLLQSPSVVIPGLPSRRATLRSSRPSRPGEPDCSGYMLLTEMDIATNFEPSLPRVHLALAEGFGPKLYYIGTFPAEDINVNIPIPSYWDVRLTQQKIVKSFPNWQPGRFERSFPDLARAAKGLEALELDELKRIVSEDAARGSEVLEVFGFKFPVDKVTVWSTVVLWCIQLYFLVYLKQLSGKLGQTDAGWDVPWIGMNQSRLARFLLLVTISFLPSMSLAFLGVRSFQHLNWFAVVNGLGLIGSLILGVWCWKNRPRPTEPVAPAQLFE